MVMVILAAYSSLGTWLPYTSCEAGLVCCVLCAGYFAVNSFRLKRAAESGRFEEEEKQRWFVRGL